jgi:hypothetical protein
MEKRLMTTPTGVASPPTEQIGHESDRKTKQSRRRASSFGILLVVNVTKIFIVAISFSAALAVLPAAAQTGYGVKKNAPSRSTFDRG